MGITDWNRPARAVHDWIRALTCAYSGAFTFIAGRKVMLWASAVDGARPGGTPGEVLGYDDDGMRVATADGAHRGDDRPRMPTRRPGPPPPGRSTSGLRPGDEFEPVPAGTAAWALGLGPQACEDRAVVTHGQDAVVVIAAHPDDELLGAGGTLARHVRDGDEVHAIVVADGAGSRYPAELVSTLEKQAPSAADVIGFTSLQFLRSPTSGLTPFR